jgi:hypothetical protein
MKLAARISLFLLPLLILSVFQSTPALAQSQGQLCVSISDPACSDPALVKVTCSSISMCCYCPPAVPKLYCNTPVCPVPTATPTPPPGSTPTRVPTRTPTPPPGSTSTPIPPTPTPFTGTPPDQDPTCGGHEQPCCGAIPNTVGDCDTAPSGLFCTDTAVNGTRCCLQTDASPVCYTGLNTTPVPAWKDIAFCGQDIKKGANTAIGCFDVINFKNSISLLLQWATGIVGGIFLLMLIFAGFTIATAAGDPKKITAGREMLTSAITGIILIVISITLLNFIGAFVLNLTGF